VEDVKAPTPRPESKDASSGSADKNLPEEAQAAGDKPTGIDTGADNSEERKDRERPLGELLTEAGYVTEDQLNHALRVQIKLKKKKRIGRILIELGYLSDDEMRELLEKFSRRVRLGDLLVEREFITVTELERALEVQKSRPNLRLGEILIKEKILTEKTFCDALALYMNMERLIPEFKRIDWDMLRKVSVNFLEQNHVLPYGYEQDDQYIRVVVSEKHQKSALETIHAIFGKEVLIGLATIDEMETILQYIRDRPAQANVRPLIETSTDNSVSSLLDKFIGEAISLGASDLHIEPMDSYTRIRCRVDGRLVQTGTFPRDQHKAFIARAKIVANADISENRNHQDGKTQVSFHGHPIDLRFSFYVTVFGESIAIRILNPVSNLMGLDSLEFNKYNYDRYVDEVILSSTGIVLTTGPTGSGKTTTMYSTLQFQQEDGYKIVTVEDPVEYVLHGLIQCSVDEKVGRNFTSSLRHIMRQDPDIIVLGEMRDIESARIAIHASLTGHKVYSTFHTEDATSALVRLIQMGLEGYLVGSTVLAVLAQRLVRRICNYCRELYVPNVKYLRRLGVSPQILKNKDFQRGRGCEKCHHTGYRGRLPIHELLVLEDRVRDGIMRDVSNYQIRDLATTHGGMITMSEDALYKVFKNQTTFEEVVRNVPITTVPRPIAEITKIVEV